MTLAELYFALEVPLDLFLESSPREESRSVGDFVNGLKQKLDRLHSVVTERVKLKSLRMKSCYDRKVILFWEGDKVWLYNL